jgi:Bacterial Ig-like domain (group 1)/FlgD Ig-like domain
MRLGFSLIIIFFAGVCFADYSFEWIVANPDTIYADNGITYSEISVKVIDENNLPAEYVNVWFTASLGNILPNINTDENGICVTTFWDNEEAGVSTITAILNSITVPDTIETQVVILPLNTIQECIYSPIMIKNYPNPFNPTTTIEFSIINDSKINLKVFNIKGQFIKSLANNNYTKGSHAVVWNGDDEAGKGVSSGVYYYQLYVNGIIEAVNKCVLLK